MRTARNCIGDTQFQENRKKTNPSAAEIINGRVLPGDGSNLPSAKSDEDDDDWQQLTTTKGQETRNYHDNSSYNNNWVTGAREGERANAKQSGSCWIPFFLFLSSFFVFFFTQYSPSFLPTSLQLAFKSGSESLLKMIGLLYKVFLNNKRKHFLCGLCYNCSEIIVVKFFIILLCQQDNITRMFFTINIMS